MGLSERLAVLQGVSLAALDDTHDFFAHTKYLWRLAQLESMRGRQFAVKNAVTGTTVTQRDLPKLAQKYVTNYMASATLQRLVSLFEEFVFAFLMEYYTACPESLKNKQLKLAMVLEHSSTDGIVRTVVEHHLREMSYQGLDEWFAAVEKIAAIGCPDAVTIERLKEAKASRDVLVHNKGVVNALYVERSGNVARFNSGEALEVPEPYLREMHAMLRNTVNEMANAAIVKLSRRMESKTRE